MKFSIDNKYFESDSDFKQIMKRRFVISKLGNLIYPCTSHTFSDNESENGGFVMTYNRLKILIGLIEKYKMKTYTYDDLFD